MKIAFATQDKQCVNAHFGWARHIAVYDVAPEGCRYVETFDFGPGLQEHGMEDKLSSKLAAIRDCAIVYVSAIGGSAAARVVALKVHPMKVVEPEPIFDILDKLRAVLQGKPPPWLRKALMKGVQREFDPDAPDQEQSEVRHGA